MFKNKNTDFFKGYRCVACRWKIIDCLCNDEMSTGVWGEAEYWAYCSNKGCKNHEGEAYHQFDPEWFDLKREDEGYE